MLAPIDAVATVDAGDESVTLRLNMRTLALAKTGGVNLLKTGSLSDLDPLDLAILVAAFATPEQPDFDEEQAFAMLVRHPAETKTALVKLTAQFAAAAGAKENDAHPTNRRTKAPPIS